jgi:hypothetical protein
MTFLIINSLKMDTKHFSSYFFILGFALLVAGFFIRSFFVKSGHDLVWLPMVLNTVLLPSFYFFNVGFSKRNHSWQHFTYLAGGILFIYLLAEVLGGGNPFGSEFLMKVYGVVLGIIIISITLIQPFRKRLMKK